MTNKFLVFLALAAFVLACTSEVKNDQSTEKIYKTYCIACHGLYGDMGASGAANLQASKLTVEERVAVITKGRNMMASFESLLSPEEIQAVAAYTTNLKKSQ